MLTFSRNRLTVLIISALTVSGLHQQTFGEDINNGEHRLVDYVWTLPGINTITVGRTTDGSLTVTAGGNVTTNLLNIGRAGGNGQVDVINGGIINITNTNSYAYPLAVGGEGSSGNGSLGHTGILNISGAGSQVNINTPNGELSVGSQGARGYLNISDGGKLNVFNKGELYIGSRGVSDSKGIVTIDGAGSELFVNERVLIGTYNDGRMIISNGGKFSTNDYISIGRSADTRKDDSLLVVTGNGSLAQSANETVLGSSGKGTAVVSNGGRLAASQIKIADLAGSTGELAIGSRAGEAAVAAGIIDTSLIQFGVGQGVVTFNHTDTDYEFTPVIKGNGNVNALSGTTLLMGANLYTGATTIADGATIQAGAADVLSPNSGHIISTGGVLNLNGHDQTIPSLTNAGTVTLSGDSQTTGASLSITGDYIGNDGSLIFNTALGTDTSTTDKLFIGGNASGTTQVSVRNLGGHGAETVEGLQIIDIGGTSATGTFVQNGRIVAGAYEYQLVKGNTSQTDTEGWYLTSEYHAPPLPPPPGGGAGGQSTHILRPEAGAYLANLAAVNVMASLPLHDRLGETQYTDLLSGEQKVTSLWIRQNYGRNQFKDSTGQLSTSADRTILQIGGDIAQWSTNAQNRFHLGIMGGYGSADSNTTASLSNHRTTSKIHGYTVGIYGTWYASQTDKSGLYLDSWLTWADYNARIRGDGIEQEYYKLNGLTASLETGYAFRIAQTQSSRSIWLQPQAQITWMGIDSDHTESNGTIVEGSKHNIQTRLGVRIYLNNNNPDNHSDTRIQPYLTANWIHNTKPYEVLMDGDGVKQDGTRNIGEIKLGAEVNYKRHTSLWFNLAQQFGRKDYRDTSAMVGVKYSF